MFIIAFLVQLISILASLFMAMLTYIAVKWEDTWLVAICAIYWAFVLFGIGMAII